MIERPEVEFEAIKHEYSLDGRKLAGVSSVAKLGGAEKSFDIASKWGFRLGYEGAYKLAEEGDLRTLYSDEWALRKALSEEGLAPWSKRDRAAERGSWVHDVLEHLGQDGKVPSLDEFPPEVRAHVRSVLRWFLWLRPSFVAMEVQIASRTHGFAGRYDVRLKADARKLLECIDPLRDDWQAKRIRELAAVGKDALGLVDLKTSKSVYPETHFPQLEGYEGGGVEMGFPETDFRAVLNTNEDESFEPARDFAISWATYDDFLGLLAAFRAIRDMEDRDPDRKRRKLREETILANLPARSRDLVELRLPELDGMDSRSIGKVLGGLRKRELVEQVKGYVWQRVAGD
jgi:hypothetical protein